ncbi:unnamed protein product [Amoebophrya sp. A120]|nr:unnamed protein product [Amoebophrya sp. A120]|eukprot:GSA120T00001395001.1
MFSAGKRLLSSAKPSNLHVITSASQYEALKMSSRALVGYFSAGFSTPSKIYEKSFAEMAGKNSDYTFFTCDIDAAPTVAYDCEVVDVPSVSVLPLGSKPDGSTFDKSDMVTLRAGESLDYGTVIPKAQGVLDGMPLNCTDLTAGQRKPWRFDPATGTTLPPLP